MKRALFLALAIIPMLLCPYAPSKAGQSDTGSVNITLEARHHAFIIAFIPKDGEVEKTRYIHQVAQALLVPVDSGQLIPVTVRRSLIPELYQTLGNQQERLTAEFNRSLKYILLDQLQEHPDILAAIMEVAVRNETELEVILNSGFQYLQALK